MTRYDVICPSAPWENTTTDEDRQTMDEIADLLFGSRWEDDLLIAA